MLRILALLMVILLFACSDDSGTGPGNNGGVDLGNFRVDIDGTRWNATEGSVLSSVFIDENSSVLTVTAIKSLSANTSETISLNVAGQVINAAGLEGSYDLDASGVAALLFITTNSTYFSIDGQIVIDNISANNVSGSFNAICVNSQALQDTIALTGGSFNALIFAP